MEDEGDTIWKRGECAGYEEEGTCQGEKITIKRFVSELILTVEEMLRAESARTDLQSKYRAYFDYDSFISAYSKHLTTEQSV
jgi:hypothetical protein